MKIVCSQSDLKNNLSLVSRAVPSRAEPAVLANVLMIATEATQKVSMVAFDGSMGIKTSFNAEVVQGGRITLPAKLFNDIVTRLPEMEITLDAGDEEESFIATISSVGGEFKLTG
ncbi:MAG: DNA polymerase III subunit beta, partial [Pleurocapsa sp.]